MYRQCIGGCLKIHVRVQCKFVVAMRLVKTQAWNRGPMVFAIVNAIETNRMLRKHI